MVLTVRYLVRVPVTDIWETMAENEGPGRLTQALLGDQILLKEKKGSWAKVQVADSYCGYLKRAHLIPASASRPYPWGVVIRASTSIQPQSDDCPRPLTAYLGTRLQLASNSNGPKDNSYTVFLPAGGKGSVGKGALALIGQGLSLVAKVERVQELAHCFLGSPYLWGGITSAGIDCSGLVQTVYRGLGLLVPRDVDQQFLYSQPRAGKPQRGDLVFFAPEEEGTASHVGLYLGSGQFIHASSRLGGVVMTSLNSPFYRRCFLGWRRWQEKGSYPSLAAGFDWAQGEVNTEKF